MPAPCLSQIPLALVEAELLASTPCCATSLILLSSVSVSPRHRSSPQREPTSMDTRLSTLKTNSGCHHCCSWLLPGDVWVFFIQKSPNSWGKKCGLLHTCPVSSKLGCATHEKIFGKQAQRGWLNKAALSFAGPTHCLLLWHCQQHRFGIDSGNSLLPFASWGVWDCQSVLRFTRVCPGLRFCPATLPCLCCEAAAAACVPQIPPYDVCGK